MQNYTELLASESETNNSESWSIFIHSDIIAYHRCASAMVFVMDSYDAPG